MVYSELGNVPLSAKREHTVIKSWIKLLSSKNGILNSISFDMLDSCSGDTVDPSQWLYEVKQLLLSLGFRGVWYA